MENRNAFNCGSDFEKNAADAHFSPIGKILDLDNVPTVGNDKLCLGMECLDRDLWDFDAAFDHYPPLGIKHVRLQSGWQKTEKKKGVYDFAWLDSIMEKLTKAGIVPFLSLSYSNSLYCSEPDRFPDMPLGGIGHVPVGTEEERAGWLSYVRAIVTRYKDVVKEYEIWNEPDVAKFCAYGDRWPEVYLELVKLTAPVIRECCPDAVVISCTGSVERTRLLLEMGMGQYVDVHSFHGYVFHPELQSADYRTQLERVASRLAPGLRLWRGEAGCTSHVEVKGLGALSNLELTEAKQAKFLLRHLTADMANNGLERTSYFHAFDFEHFSHVCRYHYGVVRDDMQRKPSYYALQLFARLFDGKVTAVSPCALAPRADKCKNLLSPEEILLVRCAEFRPEGRHSFFSYVLATPIEDDTPVRRAVFSMPEGCVDIEHPVIVDPLSRRIYPVGDVNAFEAPLCDYTMFIADAEDIAAFAELDLPGSSDSSSGSSSDDLRRGDATELAGAR